GGGNDVGQQAGLDQIVAGLFERLRAIHASLRWYPANGRTSGGVRQSPAGRRASVVEPGHRADRAAGAAGDLQGKSDEGEAACAYERAWVGEAFKVREAEGAAEGGDLEIVTARRAGAHRLDAEHHDALAAEPRRRLARQSGKVGEIAVGAVTAPIEVHVQQ